MAAELVKNEFGAAAPAPAFGGMISTVQQREIAEVQSKMIIARSCPRNEMVALDRILNACTRLGLAKSALYEYARGGTAITGPSIRLAETIAQNWGNIDFGIRELEQRDGESTVEAYAWDMQTNASQRKIFQVPHVRYSKDKGNVKLSDPRDIYELVANNGARRLRACILGIIPGDIIEAAVEQCKMTQNTHWTPTPENIKVMLATFAELGVTKKQIETYIQRDINAITAGLMSKLKNIENSIRDGMSKPSEWFTASEPDTDKKHGVVNIDDLKAGSENRGHGNENLGASAATSAPEKKTKPEPVPAPKPEPAPSTKPLIPGSDPFEG